MRPVAICYAALSLLLILLWALGMKLNGDADDLLKLHELRTFLQSWNVFDRTLPGIVRPEPYVSHWPWIVDLPYAMFAVLASPFAGTEQALAAACFAVPLILLAPALWLYGRLIAAAVVTPLTVAMPVATIVSLRCFFEFAPGRIDYHNLQILLLVAALVLLLQEHRRAAFLNGLLTALALAISIEFAPFYLLLMAVYAVDFVFKRSDGVVRLKSFGAALAIAALLLFVAIVAPQNYLAARCDSYSSPHLMALGSAGLIFCLASSLGLRGGWPARALALLVPAAACAATLAFLFPQCLAGPYGGVDVYIRDNLIARIAQEHSLVARPDFVLSGSLAAMTILFVGALALPVAAIRDRGANRALAVIALFSLLAVALGVAQFRYLRYVALFSGIGMLFVFAALLPAGSRWANLLGRDRLAAGMRFVLPLPGLCLAGLVVLVNWAAHSANAAIPAAELAESCDRAAHERLSWPDGNRIMAPPSIGAELLAQSSRARVIAVPNHPSAAGAERAYRFLDPQTADPRALLEASQATHVVLCAWQGDRLPALAQAYPFLAALMEGRPPLWLMQCQAQTLSPLRIYAYSRRDGSVAACPAAIAAQPDP